MSDAVSHAEGRLDGKSCIVTGAGSGIGRATCTTFSNAGASVLCADINFDGAEKTAAACAGPALAIALDVTQPESWQSCIDRSVDEFGTVDVLVNCAGIGRSGDYEEFSLEDWDAMIAVNLTGVFLGCQNAMRRMRLQKKGVIINISSIAATLGGADIACYSATKGGVTALTKAVAMHGAQYGVRVCAIAPTYVDTEMLDGAEENFSSRQEMLSSMAELIPMGRVAVPEDIASAIVLLASDEAAMITGSTLFVDGGQTSGMPSRHSN